MDPASGPHGDVADRGELAGFEELDRRSVHHRAARAVHPDAVTVELGLEGVGVQRSEVGVEVVAREFLGESQAVVEHARGAGPVGVLGEDDDLGMRHSAEVVRSGE